MSSWKNRPFGVRLRCALHGFAHAAAAEASLRLQLLGLAGVLVALAVLRPAPLWWALAAVSAAGVLACELLNSAIERLADALHPAEHAAIRAAKDCAAAAVLLACLGALGVAAAFLWHVLHAPP